MRVVLSGRGVVLTPAFRARVARKGLRPWSVGSPHEVARILCPAEAFGRTAWVAVRGAGGAFASQATAPGRAIASDHALAAVERQRATAKDRPRARRRLSRSP